MNSTLKKYSDSLLEQSLEQFEASGEPQRNFCARWYRAGSWPAERWVVIKCEAHAAGTNRRAVVTNRPGAFVLPGAAYDEYADRGESENRNKELKCGLQADRLSDHRYMDHGYRSTVVADCCGTRALPDRKGGAMSAQVLHDVTLAALADRFAVVVERGDEVV
jgi:hypothetical protein